MAKDPSSSPTHSHNGRAVKIGEAAKILGVHQDTLRRWEKGGKITPLRSPGGTRLFSLDELSAINSGLPINTLKEPQLGQDLFEKNVEKISNNMGATLDPKPIIKPAEFLAISSAIFLLLVTLGIGNIRLASYKSYLPTPSPAVLGKSELVTVSQPSATASPESTSSSTLKPSPSPISEVKKMVTIKIDDGATSVNIRQKPSTDSQKLGKAYENETFEFTSLTSGWYEIKLPDGSIGYISSRYLIKENHE